MGTSLPAGAQRRPRSGVIEVWLVPLPARPSPGDLALLDPVEAAAAAQFSSAALAARYAAGRAAVRRIVGRAVGIDPAELPIERERCPRCADDTPSAHGRPQVALPRCRIRFNLSRTASLAAVAVADGCDVGVDVEAVRPANLAALDRHTLSFEDRARIAHAPAQDRAELFFRSWCRKEASTKAAGVGIVTDLRGIDTRPQRPGPVSVRVSVSAATATHWQVWDLPLGAGLVGAVAWPLESVRELVVRREPPPWGVF